VLDVARWIRDELTRWRDRRPGKIRRRRPARYIPLPRHARTSRMIFLQIVAAMV